MTPNSDPKRTSELPCNRMPVVRRLPSTILLVLSVVVVEPARADWLYTFIHYSCNAKAGMVRIDYVGAYNERGEAISAQKDPDTWSTDELLRIPAAPPIPSNTVRRHCAVDEKNEFLVDITAITSGNQQGECGTHTQVRATVWAPFNTEPTQIEFAPSCRSDSIVTTSVEFSAESKKWQLEQMLASDFYSSSK